MSDKEREAEEEKGRKESSIQFSRRGFLKGLGTGAASVAIRDAPDLAARSGGGPGFRG